MKEITLNKVKVNEVYQFQVLSDAGAGSGSQSFYTKVGKVKEINAEFVRVFNGVGKQSDKIRNRHIVRIYSGY